MAWYVRYGLGGGFGGCGDWEVDSEATNKEEALIYAESSARDVYESYEGLHGLLEYDQFMLDNPEATDEDFEEERNNDIESWIDYEAEWFDTNPNEE